MESLDKKQMKEWVETWKRAGVALQEVKREELRSFDYSKNQPRIDEMLQWAADHQIPRLSCGLIEQQRLFLKMRKWILNFKQDWKFNSLFRERDGNQVVRL